MDYIVCSVCGVHEHDIARDAIMNIMLQEQICFDCYFWRYEVIGDLQGDPMAARINGVHYYIEAEDGPSFPRGHGGARFVIQFDDGRVVTTTNLWTQGEIPDLWKEELPDNARFLDTYQQPPDAIKFLWED